MNLTYVPATPALPKVGHPLAGGGMSLPHIVKFIQNQRK